MELKSVTRKDIEELKKRLSTLKGTNTSLNVTFNVRSKNPTETVAEISGIYPNFFGIILQKGKHRETMSISYSSIIAGEVKIEELG